MRLLAVLLLALAVCFAGCGGDEYTENPTGTTDEPGTTPNGGEPGGTPDKPAVPRPAASAAAVEIAAAYKKVKAVRDFDTKKTRALAAVAPYEGASVPADASFYLGLLYRFAQEQGKAADAFVKFMDGCPTDRNVKTARYYAALDFAKAGRITEATRYFNELTANHGDEKDMIKSVAGALAPALAIEGNFTEAATVYGQAKSAGADYAGEEMVRCLWALGKYDEARTKAAVLTTEFKGMTEEDRYTTLNQQAQKMGKPAFKIPAAGWSMDFNADQLDGKVHLVYFWSLHVRGTASKTEKSLKVLFDRYSGEPFAIAGLSQPAGFDITDMESKRALTTEDEVINLKAWGQTYKAPWPLGLVIGDETHNAYGYRDKVPAMAVVDKKGNLRYFRDSAGDDTYKIIAKVIERLLDE